MLKIYIITTIVSIIIFEVQTHDIKVEVKRKGIQPQNKVVGKLLRPYLIMLLPIINILTAVVSVFTFDDIKNKTLHEWEDEIK